MLWVLKRTVLMRRFFWAPKTHALMSKEINEILGAHISLFEPMGNYKQYNVEGNAPMPSGKL